MKQKFLKTLSLMNIYTFTVQYIKRQNDKKVNLLSSVKIFQRTKQFVSNVNGQLSEGKKFNLYYLLI